MSSDTAQPGKPTVIYNPLRLNWKNVVAGTVIALLMVAIGVFSFTYYNPDATPVPPVVIKSGTQSAKTSKATPSAEKKETADWRTFTGDIKLRGGDPTKTTKISLKYPNGYKVSEDEYGSTVISTQSYLLIVGPKNNEIGISLEYLTTTGSNNLIKNYGKVKEKTSLGEKDANKYVLNSGDIETIVYVVPKLSTDYSFHLRCIFLESNTVDLSQECAAITSTFKFLD